MKWRVPDMMPCGVGFAPGGKVSRARRSPYGTRDEVRDLVRVRLEGCLRWLALLGMLGGGGRTAKKFGWIHAIACPNDNTLYVANF